MKSKTKKLVLSASCAVLGAVMFPLALPAPIFLGLPMMLVGMGLLLAGVGFTFVVGLGVLYEWWHGWPTIRYWLESDD